MTLNAKHLFLLTKTPNCWTKNQLINTMRVSSTFFSIVTTTTLVLLETPAVFAQTCLPVWGNCLGNEDSCCGGLKCQGGKWSKQCKNDPSASCLHEWADCTNNVDGKSIMVAIRDSPYNLSAFFFTL
jgi:hypothetical protein